jgi:hypothetical protein
MWLTAKLPSVNLIARTNFTGGITMLTATSKPTSQELVQQKYPDAFVDDDGQWIYIMVRKTITEECPTCGKNWTHKVVDHTNILGSAGNESSAWESAARNLGLI